MRFSRFMTAAVLVAMGCAQQEQNNDAAPDDSDEMPEGGSSAGKAAGGSSNKAGSDATAGKPGGQAGTASAGKGGTGSDDGGSGGGGMAGKAAGGGGGTAGKANGGNGGTAGTGGKAAGGAGSGGGGGKAAGGSGGGSGGPCKANSSGPVAGLSLRYESEVDVATGTNVGSQIAIYNTSSNTFNLADLRVRYYLTNEVAAALDKTINWAWVRPIAGGQTDIKSKVEFNVVDPGCSATDADTYFEFTFKADAGLLEPQSYVLFSWVASNGATQNFDQSNDYSFSAGQAIGSDYSKIVLLQNNLNRLWGTEP
jgi:hypothetical protein